MRASINGQNLAHENHRRGATIWTTQAPEWAWIDEALPQHAGQPLPVA